MYSRKTIENNIEIFHLAWQDASAMYNGRHETMDGDTEMRLAERKEWRGVKKGGQKSKETTSPSFPSLNRRAKFVYANFNCGPRRNS